MPSLRDVFTLWIDLAPALEIGHTPQGFRRVILIAGGSFDGPAARGRILPGGADWNVVRPDGTAHLWARYTAEADDGVLIMVTNVGLRPRDDAMRQDLTAGGSAGTEGWYCRTTPTFEVGQSRHDWLNRGVFVGDMRPRTRQDQVVIDVYLVT